MQETCAGHVLCLLGFGFVFFSTNALYDMEICIYADIQKPELGIPLRVLLA